MLIKNATIYTMSDLNYDTGYILIEDGKISEVGNMDHCPVVSEGMEVIDALGCYVLPGLIDSHCHVGIWEDSVGFEGSDGNETTCLSQE